MLKYANVQTYREDAQSRSVNIKELAYPTTFYAHGNLLRSTAFTDFARRAKSTRQQLGAKKTRQEMQTLTAISRRPTRTCANRAMEKNVISAIGLPLPECEAKSYGIATQHAHGGLASYPAWCLYATNASN